jgi:xylose isomerase
MDTFARALVVADSVLKESNYLSLRKTRYESFDKGQGKEFESGKLTLEHLREIAAASGEPVTVSGKQELYEQLINMYL